MPSNNQTSRNPTNPEQNRNIGKRCITSDGIRSVEGKERTFVLSFSSEEPYERWFGMEILDHEADSVDLGRLNSIGVLLFNHDVDKVCGKVNRAWIENNRGYAEVEFDNDDFSELIHEKVKSGTLKATSVRYSVDSWEEVVKDKKSKSGKYNGPCFVAIKWTPLEVSIVSVPADPTVGVGRNYEEQPEPDCEKNAESLGRSHNVIQATINKNLSR